MAQMPAGPRIKSDHILIHELELVDVFNYDRLDPDTKNEIDKANTRFERRNLIPTLMRYIGPCPCRTQKIQERAMRRAQIMGHVGPIAIQPTQDDFDAVTFGVVVIAEGGIHKEVRLVVTHCNDCGKMEFYGDLGVTMGLMTDAFAKFFNDDRVAESKAAQNDEFMKKVPKELMGSAYITEDVDTGELTGADTLAEALLGKNPTGPSPSLDLGEASSEQT